MLKDVGDIATERFTFDGSDVVDVMDAFGTEELVAIRLNGVMPKDGRVRQR